MSSEMRTRLAVSCLLLIAATASAEPARVKPSTLPEWWPSAQFAYGVPIVAEDYAQADFATGPKPPNHERPTITVRGRHWHAYLVRFREEEKAQTHPDGDAKWRLLKSDLEAKGFRLIDDEETKARVFASFRQAKATRRPGPSSSSATPSTPVSSRPSRSPRIR